MASGSNADKTLSLAGLQFIKDAEEEGGKPKLRAYDDGTGTFTIGWGCTKGVTRGMRITVPEAEAMLDEELAGHIDEVHRLILRPISQGLFDALVSFFFNNGAGRCPTLINAVNVKDDDAIRKAFMLYTKAYDAKKKATVTWPGLVRRRTLELQHWSKMDDMDPKVDTPVVSARVPAPVEPTEPSPPNPIIEGAKSTSAWGLLGTIGGFVADAVFDVGTWAKDRIGDVVEILKSTQTEADDVIAPLISIGEKAQFNLGHVAKWVVIVTLFVVFIRHIQKRVELAHAKNGTTP